MVRSRVRGTVSRSGTPCGGSVVTMRAVRCRVTVRAVDPQQLFMRRVIIVHVGEQRFGGVQAEAKREEPRGERTENTRATEHQSKHRVATACRARQHPCCAYAADPCRCRNRHEVQRFSGSREQADRTNRVGALLHHSPPPAVSGRAIGEARLRWCVAMGSSAWLRRAQDGYCPVHGAECLSLRYFDKSSSLE